MRKTLIFTATFLIVASLTMMLAAERVLADSLWSDQSSSLYALKGRTFQVGDLLTIVIVEQAQATQQANSTNEKKNSITAGPGTGLLNAIPGMGLSSDGSYTGTGATTRGGSLTAKLTVEVKEVNPNGLLVVEGNQVIKVNGEEQTITIRGTARSQDVAPDNTILSSSVANAVIEYQGKGTIGETQQPGVITKFFHWLF